MKQIKIFFFTIIFIFISFSILSKEYIDYEVKKGETIWRISQNFGITVNELCRINDIIDITKVKTGMIIKIPQNKQTEVQSTASCGIHILQKGETIWQLSKKYQIQADELCKINNIENLNKLLPGTKIGKFHKIAIKKYLLIKPQKHLQMKIILLIH